jgi:hypothetical protein
MFEFSISPAGQLVCNQLLQKLLQASVGKAVIFLSGPATGAPHYQERFKYIKDQLYRNGFDFHEYYIINPMELYDGIGDRSVTYIDKLNIGYKIIETLVDAIVVDDNNEEALRNSRGCMVELTQAYNSRIPIMYVSELLPNNKDFEESGEKDG